MIVVWLIDTKILFILWLALWDGQQNAICFAKEKVCETSVDSSSISGALSFSSWEPHAVTLPSRPCESFGIFEISKSLSKHILEFNQGTWSLFCRLQTMNSFPNFFSFFKNSNPIRQGPAAHRGGERDFVNGKNFFLFWDDRNFHPWDSFPGKP